MPRRSRLAGIVLVVALVAAACGGKGGGSTSGSPSGGVIEGGVLKFGTLSNIDSLNPFVAFQQDAYATFIYIYPSLVQYDTTTLKFAPDFALKWEPSSDGLTWTFHTAPNAKWSDGQPLTAADAAWTFNTIIKFGDGATANWIGSFSHVTSITATDPNTLEIVYSKPVANVEANMQAVPILPQHVWEQYATGNGKALKTTPNQPTASQPIVSGGPFILVQYKKDDVVIYKTNPNFYGPKPHIAGFGMQYYSNQDAMIQALKSGAIDATEDIPVTAKAALEGDSSIVVMKAAGVELRDFIINSSPNKVTNPELKDPKVRMAMEYAIDRNKILSTAWLGTGSIGSTIVPPSTGDWHDSNIQPLPFDVGKANSLLDGAGYAKGAGGVRVANGHPMSYDVIFASDESGSGDRSFQIIQQGFQQIGIKITQKKLDNSAAFDAITAPDNKYAQFDLAMWDWVPAIDPDFILSVMQCNQFGGWSDSGYCNKSYDNLYQEQAVAINRTDRLNIVYQMQKMLYDDRPYIVLNYNDVIQSHSKKWDGFVQSPQGWFNSLSKQSLIQVHQVSS